VQGTWLVERSSDDDLIGFVFGFLDPGHFYVFDWKGRDQEGAECGMSVKRVDVGYSGATSGQLPPGQPFEESELWYTAGVEGRTRLIHHEDTPGWEFDRPYTFQLETQRGWFRIIVKDGSHTLYDRVHHDSNYDPGRFGFYNYSQERVVYRGFETIESPADRVSVWRFAIAGALLIIVIAALVAQRRRRHIQEG
jgi:hypothetical protein